MASFKQILHAFVWLKRHYSGQLDVGKTTFFKAFIAEDDVCLDIGAHAGSWAKPLSNIVSKGSVYAFEALPYYSNVLKLTLKLLGCRNVFVFNKAITEKPEQVQIVWKDRNDKRLTGMTHIAGKEESQKDTVSVEGITIDDFVAGCHEIDKVRFIKMDIEGAELLALRGGKSVIDQFRPILFLELCDKYCERYGYKDEDVFSYFSERNYVAYQFTEDTFDSIVEVDVGNYRGCEDVLFLPLEVSNGLNN